MSDQPVEKASELRFEGVRVQFGERPVLDEVSFALARGEVVGLLGRNGAGKTTVVRAVTGSVELEGGEILLDQKHMQ